MLQAPAPSNATKPKIRSRSPQSRPFRYDEHEACNSNGQSRIRSRPESTFDEKAPTFEVLDTSFSSSVAPSMGDLKICRGLYDCSASPENFDSIREVRRETASNPKSSNRHYQESAASATSSNSGSCARSQEYTRNMPSRERRYSTEHAEPIDPATDDSRKDSGGDARRQGMRFSRGHFSTAVTSVGASTSDTASRRPSWQLNSDSPTKSVMSC